MRRRRRAAKKDSRTGDDGNGIASSESMETSSLNMIRELGNPFKVARGRGLGKAGAKRLGRMLLQAMHPGEEPKGKGKVPLPKTPIGLLEYHFQKEANYASETDSPTLPSPQVSRFIGQVVSKYKRENGLSMAELKQMLAAEGYDVNKNKKPVNVVTKKLVNDETPVRTTRSGSYRLNNKADTSRAKNPVISPKPKPREEIKPNTIAHKFPKRAERSPQKGKKTPTPKGKSPKSKSKPKRAQGKSCTQQSKTRKCAAKSHEQRRKTPKSNLKALKPAGKKTRSVKNKGSKKTKRTPRRQAKKVQHMYKTRTREPPRDKGPRTRLRSQRRDARRTYYN